MVRLKSEHEHKKTLPQEREKRNAVIEQSNLIFNYGILMCLKTLLSFHFFVHFSSRFLSQSDERFQLFFRVQFSSVWTSVEKVNLIGVKKREEMKGSPKTLPTAKKRLWLWIFILFVELSQTFLIVLHNVMRSCASDTMSRSDEV